ncbi:MAG: DUF1450 domain-containing protein [Hydrogenibacillus schlegelii]|uniref:DUF1450 domain-containing protein n=1 Tax=Hydrogenibacillus schlegelii TaxID=1484 RepID=A0A2T5GF80_HYDSH|nr:DUF1450 domain-containing protein [Hydrogenibacillus schlegelii]MBT9281960.1 DUF1450 domain-containing protein [Hydrogenibacillus schlegelii]PTQ54852.1 MAG: hypothetical protein HSCHL_1795 [Hydrogenibacillus schlegelii]
MAKFLGLCRNNAAYRAIDDVRALAEAAGLTVVVANCQNRCAFCDVTPYALLGREVIFGDDVDEFLAELEAALAERCAACPEASAR